MYRYRVVESKGLEVLQCSEPTPIAVRDRLLLELCGGFEEVPYMNGLSAFWRKGLEL